MVTIKRQRGMSLVELLVAAAISLIAITGMVMMMSSTLGATSDTVTNARLTNELRNAMMVITRDLRRANISDTYQDCIATGDFLCAAVVDTVTVNGSCVSYGYERKGGADQFGAVRLNSGVLQYRTDAADCANSGNWQNLTDGNVMTVGTFNIEQTSGAELSYTKEISGSLSQRVRKLRFTLEGTICHARDSNNACTDSTTRSVSNVVRVRNDINFTTPAP
jgi:prepilin-type N-terminal cleavage/methylation domain-containing protein